MSTIHINQAGADPRVAFRAAKPDSDNRTVSRVTAAGAGPAAMSVPDAPALDPQTAREYIAEVQEALERLVAPPHKVTFRRDETSNGFVIEVRDPDGSLVRQYPPEKLLNLRRQLDELSGMVIDEMT